jgi:hypothetical protein
MLSLHALFWSYSRNTLDPARLNTKWVKVLSTARHVSWDIHSEKLCTDVSHDRTKNKIIITIKQGALKTRWNAQSSQTDISTETFLSSLWASLKPWHSLWKLRLYYCHCSSSSNNAAIFAAAFSSIINIIILQVIDYFCTFIVILCWLCNWL